MDQVNTELAGLGKQVATANGQLLAAEGRTTPDYVNNTVLTPLRNKRMQSLDRIASAIGRTAQRPALVSLADCDLDFDGAHAGHGGSADASSGTSAAPLAARGSATPTVNCKTVRDRLPGVPPQAVAEVNRNLDLLDRQIAEANQRLVTSQGQGGPNFIDNAILNPLKDKRTSTIDRIAIAIGRNAAKPTGLGALAACTLNNGGAAQGGANGGDKGAAGGGAAAEKELQAPAGPRLELPGNAGDIQRPISVHIEYRGNAAGKVVAMPKFLRALTGDAKPTSRGPANARASWTCTGFENRLSTKYVICPPGSQVERIHDFPGCWDGKNTDSANHRTHVAFADVDTGKCPAGFKAIPQLRTTIKYNIPRSVLLQGGYALDSFPEEDHNPFSDHDDYMNAVPDALMAQMVSCINGGRRCN
jgi:hypothetical protein